MVKHLDIFVFGDVKGVGFRAAAKAVAQNLGIMGYVRNEGRFVIIEAEAEEDTLDNFLEWCKQGPDSAKVEKVDFKEGHLKTFREFSIL
ncbi:MAG: acylphosphatase [Candidatus Doudnabacteria bacterium]|nr:acylphosphatase [Candidatus Doudnabacteria bacterium]